MNKQDFFNGNGYIRIKVPDELFQKGITEIIINKNPRQIIVTYGREGKQMEPVAKPCLEFLYPTVDQFDEVVDWDLETLTGFKGYIILKLYPHWNYIYNGNGNWNGEATKQEQSIPRVTKQDIDFVIETMVKEAEHEKVSIKQLFFGMLTGFTKLPMNHIVNSKSAGAGKSYLLILVAKYFPKRYVLVLMGASDKSLHHREGTMVLEDLDTGELTEVEPIIKSIRIEILAFKEQLEAEKDKKDKKDKNLIKNLQKQISEKEEEITSILERQAKLVSLNDTIILFVDTPQDGFFDALMSVLSNDTDTDQKYVFTDKSSSGKLVSRTNIFRGTPVMFATRVIDDTANKRFEERNRRFINVTPNVSPQKIEDANALILKGAGLTPEEYDEAVVNRQDKEKSAKIVSLIVEKLRNHSKYLGPKQYGIKIPFIDSIKIPNQIEWSMTVMRRLVGYLAIVTKVRMDSRPRLVRTDNPNIFLPISTFEDFRESLELMKIGASSIRPYLAEWYAEVFLPAFDAEHEIKKEERDGTTLKENYISVSSSQLREKHKEVKGIPISGDDLRHKYIDPLINHGLIEKTKSEIRKSENIYFPVDEKGDNIFSLFSQDLKLPVKASLYPTKEVIISAFSRLFENQAQKKYREDGGKVFEKNISIYRLEDADGREITPEQLADRYFSNPEICFSKENKESE